jgi:hypothetical protein
MPFTGGGGGHNWWTNTKRLLKTKHVFCTAPRTCTIPAEVLPWFQSNLVLLPKFLCQQSRNRTLCKGRLEGQCYSWTVEGQRPRCTRHKLWVCLPSLKLCSLSWQGSLMSAKMCKVVWYLPFSFRIFLFIFHIVSFPHIFAEASWRQRRQKNKIVKAAAGLFGPNAMAKCFVFPRSTNCTEFFL